MIILMFDLSKDLANAALAATIPAEAERLRRWFEKCLSDVDAQFPMVNANYDPNRPVEPDHGKRRGEKSRTARSQTAEITSS